MQRVLQAGLIAALALSVQSPAYADTFHDKLADGGDGPEMVTIPSGSFMMGSPASEAGRYASMESPQHAVRITYSFAVQRADVMWIEYARCVADGACQAAKDDGFGNGTLPVTGVSWSDAHDYVRWLSRKTGKSYRLLSEAEWEYAARAGTTTAYYWGEAWDASRANMSGSKTSPSGEFRGNAFGLFDMTGNVMQWVEDCYDTYSTGQPSDGSAYVGGSCSTRVVRGGSWFDNPRILRSAARAQLAPSVRGPVIGFRVARSLP